MTRSPSSTDTPQGQPERHCEHECVCWFANGGMRPTELSGPCCIPCKHDTRSRPHTSTPEQCRYWGERNGKHICALLIPDPELYIELISADQAALIQRTREEVLAHLIAKLSEAKSQIESSAMGGSITERNRGRIIGILDALIVIGSLRSQPPTTGSTTSPAKGKEGE